MGEQEIYRGFSSRTPGPLYRLLPRSLSMRGLFCDAEPGLLDFYFPTTPEKFSILVRIFFFNFEILEIFAQIKRAKERNLCVSKLKHLLFVVDKLHLK